MNKKRSRHVPKSPPQREAYKRYIEVVDYAPTVDETLPFDDSTRKGPDRSEPTARPPRQPALKQRILEHFQECWVQWMVGLVLGILGWLMLDAKIDISTLFVRCDNMKESIEDVETTAKQNTDHLHEQDLKIQENKLRFELENRSKSLPTKDSTVPTEGAPSVVQ